MRLHPLERRGDHLPLEKLEEDEKRCFSANHLPLLNLLAIHRRIMGSCERKRERPKERRTLREILAK